MAMSIGVDATGDVWRVCRVRDGQVANCAAYANVEDVLAELTSVESGDGDDVLAIATDLQGPLVWLHEMSEEALQQRLAEMGSAARREELSALLRAVRALPLKSVLVPALDYLSGIPSYRRLIHPSMGGAGCVCSLATLCYRMRRRDASWSEINFIYLAAQSTSYEMAVVQDGLVVDGLARKIDAVEVDDRVLVTAFWEALTQDLAALIAVHHLEDVVVVDQCAQETYTGLRDISIIDRLGELYQLYHFPQESGEPEACTIALGAAYLAEGLQRPGLAAEVTQRLLGGAAQA